MISINCSSKLLKLVYSSQLNRIANLHLNSIQKKNQVNVAREIKYFKEIYSDDFQFKQLESILNNKKIFEDEKIVSFDNFVKSTEYNDNRLANYFNTFTNDLKDKDMDSLIFVLNRLRESKFKYLYSSSQSLITFLDENLTNYLDKETSITNEKFELLFQIALLFDELGLKKWSKFINLLAKKPLNDFVLFENKENLLRLMYIWNLSRKPVESDRALLIELQVIKFFHYNQIDLKECGIVCLGFHKCQIKFKSNLIERITDKLINDIDQLDDSICLSSILKGILSSDYKLEIKLLNQLKNTILSSKFGNDFIAITKLLQITKKYKNFDEQLINKTVDLFNKQDNVRIKELCRILSSLLYFDVQLNSKQIGKFNEQFKQLQPYYTRYRIEYFLSVFALASYGIISKENIYNIFEFDFIHSLGSKLQEMSYFFVNLNNILKIYGNYRDVTLKDKKLINIFKDIKPISQQEVYNRFKKFDHYPSKLWLTYQTLKEYLNNRVNLIHVLPGVKYPTIVISNSNNSLNNYPFEVAVNVANDLTIVQVPNLDVYCDKELKRFNGLYKLENDLLKQMGFKILNLENERISHNLNELKSYVKEEIIDKLDQ